MPQMQFQREKQKPSPESSDKDRNLTVTSCTGNDTIGNRAHDAGKDFRRARYSQSGCCQDCQRNSRSLEHRMSPAQGIIPLASIKQAMEMQAEAEHRVKETSRANST